MAIICDCLYYEWTGAETGSATLLPEGEYNAYPYFLVSIGGTDYYIWTIDGNDWYLSDILGGAIKVGLYKDAAGCPNGNEGGFWQTSGDLGDVDIIAAPCGYTDWCLEGTHKIGKVSGSINISFTWGGKTGIWNNAPYWTWSQDTGSNLYYYTLTKSNTSIPGGCRWEVREVAFLEPDPTNGTLNAYLDVLPCGQPVGIYTPIGGKTELFGVTLCRSGCLPLQDRVQRLYKSIKLPVPFQEEDRGWKGCCECRLLVLAGGPTDTWKNDVSSAWIKLSDPADSVTFVLESNGVPTAYTPPVYAFPKEPDAYYTTIKWRDVLAQDGPGCYELKVSYNISGILGSFTWGEYTLKPYSIQNALQTARIRVKFNLRQEVEGINFTDANVEDTVRFYGFIGQRQPNTEIDNLIYQDRVVKSVVRENLDTWEIITDPIQDCLMHKLTDLYLLSENEMFISDYNVHNHSYRIQDIPVILQESPEIDYLDPFQRSAKLTALVGRKKKNRRTYY
jgi:hypothetical protein